MRQPDGISPPRCYTLLGDKLAANDRTRERAMAESVYKLIEIVGTSTESWEKAAKAAVDRAAKTLKDLRVAEVKELDLQLKNGKVEAYRARLKVSFKYRDKD
jgi:dodecin